MEPRSSECSIRAPRSMSPPPCGYPWTTAFVKASDTERSTPERSAGSRCPRPSRSPTRRRARGTLAGSPGRRTATLQGSAPTALHVPMRAHRETARGGGLVGGGHRGRPLLDDPVPVAGLDDPLHFAEHVRGEHGKPVRRGVHRHEVLGRHLHRLGTALVTALAEERDVLALVDGVLQLEAEPAVVVVPGRLLVLHQPLLPKLLTIHNGPSIPGD